MTHPKGRGSVMDHHGESGRSYEPPALTVLGTVHGLTLDFNWGDKKFGWSDGYLFLDDRVTNSSP
jgi:hypothetical protein